MIGWSVALALGATLALACYRIEQLQYELRQRDSAEKEKTS